jgi:hypothetical protein
MLLAQIELLRVALISSAVGPDLVSVFDEHGNIMMWMFLPM